MRKMKKGTYRKFGQRRPRSDCAHAQSDLGLLCPLTESTTSVEHIDEWGADLAARDIQLDLGIRCCILHFAKVIFLRCASESDSRRTKRYFSGMHEMHIFRLFSTFALSHLGLRPLLI